MSCDEDDIEDLAKGFENVQHASRPPTKRLIPKKFTTTIRHDKPVAESIIPGTQSVFVKTWGCAHNNSDSEYMAGLLATYGYRIVDDALSADLWLLNSCTVKTPAEDGLRNSIEAAQKLGKKVVIAGCVSQGAPSTKFIESYSVVGVQQIDRVVEVVEETLKGHNVRLLGQKKDAGKKIGGASLNLPKIRKNPLIEIIAINTGCLNQCTYCKTKHARGELGSYPIEEIVQRGVQSFEEGVREVWMTSEDTGAYGRDIGVTLPDLLREFVKIIPEGCMLRLGMTNPPYIMDHLDEMVTFLSHPRVYAFLHLPVQAASDKVLDDMKREYTISDFCYVVDFLRSKVPGINIATDIICGFPTETEEDFEMTLDLIRKYAFASLFINQFFPRPGTPAAKMKRIPANKVKERTKQASVLFASQFPYTNRIGEEQTILVTETATDNTSYVGHNKFYEQILIPKKECYMGQSLTVRIVETGKHFMKGEVLSEVKAIQIPSSYSNPEKMAFSEVTTNDHWLIRFGANSRTFILVLIFGIAIQALVILYRNSLL